MPPCHTIQRLCAYRLRNWHSPPDGLQVSVHSRYQHINEEFRWVLLVTDLESGSGGFQLVEEFCQVRERAREVFGADGALEYLVRKRASEKRNSDFELRAG